MKIFAASARFKSSSSKIRAPVGALGNPSLRAAGIQRRLISPTVILATHDPRAISIADRVLVVHDGKINHDVHAPGLGAVIQLLVS